MPLFANEDQLRKASIGGLQSAVDYVLEEILAENEKDIESIVYGGYSPNWYPRTGQFKQAWDIKSGGFGDAGGEFFFEPSNLSGGFPVHTNVDNKSVTEAMADILYVMGRGCIERPTGRNAYKALTNWLTIPRFRQIFEAGMTKAGIPWEVGYGGLIHSYTE